VSGEIGDRYTFFDIVTFVTLPRVAKRETIVAMPRSARIAPAGWIFHVLNRGNARQRLFESPKCYDDFLKLLEDSRERINMRVLAYCLMPNHWHLLLWPKLDGDLGRFLHRLTLTHAQRWHFRHQTVGHGHLYQGRYKSFPVSNDEYLWRVCRYIERNALQARLVAKAEDWRWSSLPQRIHAVGAQSAQSTPVTITEAPEALPNNWIQLVNRPQTSAELERLREALWHGRPYGPQRWRRLASKRLGIALESRPAGRPRGTVKNCGSK